MNITLKAKLLTVLPKLLALGMRSLEDVLSSFPEAKTRSAVLTLYDENGRMSIYVGFEGDKLAVREVDPENPPYATTYMTMHVDVFIALLKNKIDFRAAYLHDLIDVKSNDGLPPSYHFLLWAAFFDRVAELLK